MLEIPCEVPALKRGTSLYSHNANVADFYIEVDETIIYMSAQYSMALTGQSAVLLRRKKPSIWLSGGS